MRENHPTPSTRLVPNTNIRGAGGVFFGTLDKCSNERLVGICEETEGDWFLQKVKEKLFKFLQSRTLIIETHR